MSRYAAWPRLVVLAALALFLAAFAGAQTPTADKGPKQRTLQGIVTDVQENPLARAVVQLKNTKTLQVKSFLTDEKGGYHFNGLDPDIDYEVKADYGNTSSGTRKITSFDSRREVVINFKLDVKQQ